MDKQPVYKRVLLKISGEALAGDQKFGISHDTILQICDKIKIVYEMGVQIGIVVGGGNFWRGKTDKHNDRTTADHMGMLATVINSLALQESLETMDVETRVQTAIEMKQIAEPYIRRRAVHHLEKGRIVIFGCGTGNPFFSTDTAAALRAAEINADVILKATNTDYLYDSDPRKNPDAHKIINTTYHEVLTNKLEAMDFTTSSLCMETKIPIILFQLDDPENIVRVICGEKIGTIIND